jgi:hypothetical protein
MSNEPIKFEDAVKARLKDIVADLIPEDRWTALVADTVRQFEREGLPALVREELTKLYSERIKAEFAKPEWAGKWDQSGGPIGSDMVRELIEKAAPSILSSMIGGAVQQAVYAMQNNLPRY